MKTRHLLAQSHMAHQKIGKHLHVATTAPDPQVFQQDACLLPVAAHGGQIIVSSATAALVPEVPLRDIAVGMSRQRATCAHDLDPAGAVLTNPRLDARLSARDGQSLAKADGMCLDAHPIS